MLTTVRGERDDLMPVTRRIYLYAIPPFSVYSVLYAIEVPGVSHVASPWRETLDMRPKIGGARMNSTVTVLTESPRDRKIYPDYNLVFIPLRHLALQGSVSDLKRR